MPGRDIKSSNMASELKGIEIVVINPEEEAEFKRRLQEDPWEAVLYLASVKRGEEARELLDKLLKDAELKIQKDTVEKLKQIFTLTDGVLISGPDQQDRFIVGVAGRRYEVDMMIEPEPAAEELIPGREVWVHPDTMSIARLRDSYLQGEAAPVLEVIDETDGPGADANNINNKDINNNDINNDPDVRKPESAKPMLLKVRSRQEEIIVEAIPALAAKEPRNGDIVRIVSALGIALGLLTRGNQDVMLGEVPDVDYDDIGGLNAEITQIQEAIEEPYAFPNTFKRYDLNRPRGILLYGPPGCGKTMIAKAIANSLSKQIERSLQEVKIALSIYIRLEKNTNPTDAENEYKKWQELFQNRGNTIGTNQPSINNKNLKYEIECFLRSHGIVPAKAAEELRKINFALDQGGRSYFISIKGPELLSKWVGETESSIRGIFSMARDRATLYTPVTLFFDELEAMFSRRGSGISSDIQKTIVPQLLAEIDGIEDTRNIIVIGASNRFDLIDPAVLRPGRLDFKIKISRPNSHKNAPKPIIGKYLTVDVPFAPGELNMSAENREIKEPIITEFAMLTDCFNALLEGLLKKAPKCQAALFSTNLLEGGRLPVKTLALKAAAAVDIDNDANAAVIRDWQKNDSIAWEAVRNGKTMSQPETPDSSDKKKHVSAWPINEPGNPGNMWGVLVVVYASARTPKKVQRHIRTLIQSITGAILLRRDVAHRLSQRLLDILFHEKSRLIITEIGEKAGNTGYKPNPLTMEKQVKEIISGAMLASIVSRAKRAAVKREIQKKTFGREGITWNDLYNALRKECEEGKDQYIYELIGQDPFGRGVSYHDTDRYQVDVILPPPDETSSDDHWLITKEFAWRKSSGSNTSMRISEVRNENR